MFFHDLKYSLKILFKSKMLIFWTFAFPIILGTFFNMAFSNIENSEKLSIIDIAIVDNEAFNNNKLFKSSFEALGDSKNDDRLFNIKYVVENEAKDLLDNNEISGYLIFNEKPKVIVNTNGIEQTVLKCVVDEILQSTSIIQNVVNINKNENMTPEQMASMYESILKKIADMNDTDSSIKDTSSNNLSYTMIEFYTLIAMACLYGGTLGMVAINKNLANMSSNGKRIAVSPVKKNKLILASALASYIVHLIGIALLFIYTIFVLNVDYGDNLPMIIVLALVGSMAGLTFGIAICCIFKSNENIKIGIIISVTMFGCFLSGMMGITMKYMVDKNIPIVNKLNPASMITDGFYSLYYYDTLDRFYFNIASLAIFSLVMIAISMLSLRRQKYDSI